MNRSVPQRPAYAPGDEIRGEELHKCSDEPRLSAPLLFSLCGAGFLDEISFVRHVEAMRGPYPEYRKRVLFKMEEAGPRAITGEEKRLMV